MFSVTFAGMLRRAAIMVLGAAAMWVGLPSTAARAEAVPFWEQRDIDDAKAAQRQRKSAYRSTSARKTAKAGSRKKLGGYAAATEPRRKKAAGVKVASLGDRTFLPPKESAPSLTGGGGGVRWVASSGCLDGGLASIVNQVAANFGPVTVNSTCRSKGRNRAVGGARKSKHLSGDAVDFRVRGNVSAVYAYLRSNGGVGGLKHYGGGLFHIDTGPRRSW